MSEDISQPGSSISAQYTATRLESDGAPPKGADTASADDRRMIEALLSGSEAAFEMLIEQYHRALLRLAMEPCSQGTG
jgi:hypothetical protein